MDDTNASSPLAGELSRWLTAFAAGVRAAAAAAPDDPAQPFADEVLATVEQWLKRTRALPPPVASPMLSHGGWAELIRQEGADRELPDLAWEQLAFADGWEPFHFALLALAPERAEKLAQAAAALAAAQGAEVDVTKTEPIAAQEDRLLVPGLRDRSSVTKKGLRTARDCPLPADFATDATGDLLAAIQTAAAVAVLAGRIPNVCIPSPDPLRNELQPIVGPAYRNSVAEAVRRAVLARTPRDLWLAWVKLDEAIHAAVVLPLPHPQSWWGLLSYQLRQSLSRAADEARRTLGRIDLQVLRGEYRMIRRQSDERADVRTTMMGHPGHVAVCLRVYTAIGDERFPGRVIYRP